MSDAPPALDPNTLERLRRGVPLRMTARGELLFDEGPITHPRVRQALREGLDVSDGGEPIVRLGAQWCYLTIEDCPLRATAVRRDGDALRMRLDDGRELPLPPQSLLDEPGRGLRSQAPSRGSGRALAVRFTNQAQMDLAPWLEDAGDDRTALVLGDRRLVIPRST
ncbi:hypothetical protein [Paraliomyxa miuraensis]|uniref:hypothetical protein n=1 Tax=Paraliomyxa miuraensis TaxID=376150 RepID=UPI002259D03E|nr:hypothetical protein [Paraliomyxa miuraensis]MCX4241059.1 hypothetical protein [Paraliomyxa miuraensis]